MVGEIVNAIPWPLLGLVSSSGTMANTTLVKTKGNQRCHWVESQQSHSVAGLDGDEFVNTSLIDMYAKSGGIDSAVMVFSQMPHLDVAACRYAFRFFVKYESLGKKPNSYTYSTMLGICRILSALEERKQLHSQVVKMQYLSETTDFEKAMRKFCLMRESGIDPHEYTFTIALASCGSMKSVDNGRLLHALVIRKGMALGEFVGTAIVDMYSELGLTDDAKKQFKEMGNVASKITRNSLIKGAEKVFSHISAPDVVSWNSMIKAYSQNGNPRKAISLFRRMIMKGFRPTGSAFLAVLSACSHSGKIQDGHEMFQSMALDFTSNMPIKPTGSIWRPLLAACRCHDNLKVAGSVAKRILAMDPNDAIVYVTLSNMYTEAGLLENAKKPEKADETEEGYKRTRMQLDRSEQQDTQKIYDKLKQVVVLIKGTAYSANADLQQVKEDSSLYHSEKTCSLIWPYKLASRKAS
ncbi:hypothetical protein F3Y22_tig00003715pilonHSYRG00211 [Hibiscus syriacus]|uniref:Pentatricopeptide repeat-containing protein n=1 Tax=Hibiscus syriacus TaxID=106335 RepID=A0A6A3CQD8_HIBSY|nr:hypothetical protein F3Y22_tig00003715pilonHSYRG00211 [Hibiscus syriacus]